MNELLRFSISLKLLVFLMMSSVITLSRADGLERDVDRFGMDYRHIKLPAADPLLCQSECAGDAGCKSFTYVKPGLHGPGAVCYLKNGEPNPTPDNCCISGLRPIVTQASGLEINMDRLGMDYRHIKLPAADPLLCQSECAGDAGCKSFTYVKPGLHGPGAVCYLKNGEPNPTPNNCCISGLRSITQSQAQSVLYQALQAWRARIAPRAPVSGQRRDPLSISGQSDSLKEYAIKCDDATGIKVPGFSCSAGTEIKGQGNIPADTCARPVAGVTCAPADLPHCDQPNVLNGECDPGAKFQVLPGRTADAVAVAHCRKNGLDKDSSEYNDIAVIQYNKQNGALCFYQALGNLSGGNLPGEDIPPPLAADVSPWRWASPAATVAMGCTGCHDNGGFIRSPYLAQLKAGPGVLPNHVFPSDLSGFNNLNTPVKYVGLDYATNRSWSITTPNAPGDNGQSCTECHRLAVNNHIFIDGRGNKFAGGTAAKFANVATAATQVSKNRHGPSSPIWMRLGQVFHKSEVEASAKKFQDCAVGFFNSGFVSAPMDCEISPLGEPWTEKLGGNCSAHEQCGSGFCDAGWDTSKTNRCMPNKNGQTGDICSNDNQCGSPLICSNLQKDASGAWIPGTCASKLSLGGGCSQNYHCSSGYCDSGNNTSRTDLCMPNRNGQTGDICSNNNQCVSLICDGLTKNASGVWIPGTCVSKKSLGASCSNNIECGSGYCDSGNNTSRTDLCMPNRNGQTGNICSNNNHCASNNCVGLRAQGNIWIPGQCQ